MIKAVLFDFDGTLINTNDLIFASYKKAFKDVLNREISLGDMLKLYGRPLYSSLACYGDKQDEIYRVYREFNESRHDYMAKSFSGALEGVKKIRDKGIKTAIVTSKKPPLVKRGLEIIKMEDMFEVIVTPEDTEKTKPDPEPVLLGCKLLGVKPAESIYVGDSIFDMEAGQKAGTKLCAVKYSLTKPEQLLKFSPDYFVSTIEELADILEGNL